MDISTVLADWLSHWSWTSYLGSIQTLAATLLTPVITAALVVRVAEGSIRGALVK